MLSPVETGITCGECGGDLGRNPACKACRAWAGVDEPTKRVGARVSGAGFLKALATGAYQPPFWVWVILGGAFLYLIFPLDLIPDFIFPVGLIDDLLVVAAALTAAREAFARYLERGGKGGSDRQPPGDSL